MELGFQAGNRDMLEHRLCWFAKTKASVALKCDVHPGSRTGARAGRPRHDE